MQLKRTSVAFNEAEQFDDAVAITNLGDCDVT